MTRFACKILDVTFGVAFMVLAGAISGLTWLSTFGDKHD
jgi:hypothetical protein